MGYERDEAMRVQAATEDMIRMREPTITTPNLGGKAQRSAVRALLAACQLMIDGDWITACAAARAAIAQAEAAGITTGEDNG